MEDALGRDRRIRLIRAVSDTFIATSGGIADDAFVRMTVNDLWGQSDEDIGFALRRVRRECTGKISVKTILDRMPNQHPGPAEAWAIVYGAFDEADTVVWSVEMQRAFFDAAFELRGDRVAARLAFVSAYEREVANARANGRAPFWTVTPGTDATRRLVRVQSAVDMGRLTLERALLFAPVVGDRPSLAVLAKIKQAAAVIGRPEGRRALAQKQA